MSHQNHRKDRERTAEVFLNFEPEFDCEHKHEEPIQEAQNRNGAEQLHPEQNDLFPEPPEYKPGRTLCQRHRHLSNAPERLSTAVGLFIPFRSPLSDSHPHLSGHWPDGHPPDLAEHIRQTGRRESMPPIQGPRNRPQRIPREFQLAQHPFDLPYQAMHSRHRRNERQISKQARMEGFSATQFTDWPEVPTFNFPPRRAHNFHSQRDHFVSPHNEYHQQPDPGSAAANWYSSHLPEQYNSRSSLESYVGSDLRRAPPQGRHSHSTDVNVDKHTASDYTDREYQGFGHYSSEPYMRGGGEDEEKLVQEEDNGSEKTLRTEQRSI